MNFTMSWNEWYVVLMATVSTSFFLIIRKHFPFSARILIWIFTVNFVELFDYAIAATPFQLYYCGDNTSYEISTGVLQCFIYPPYAFVFLYFYDKWNIRGTKLLYYIIGWTLFSVLFEWTFVLSGVFNYISWKLYYSVPIYPVSHLLLLALYRFIQKHLHTPMPSNGSPAG
ncbi:hypothetical protein [Paenibacillus hamazuiensis]|uniref:hypothetical protein n=1 Tax=Paenibacillus hamazuiensis TaxID=2936508 RepID=UPI00200F6B8F|nr:hypothetical protein [Paenibacillus hamazuiensis]